MSAQPSAPHEDPYPSSVLDLGCLSDSRHLEDNQVSIIERGAFQDLKQLERL